MSTLTDSAWRAVLAAGGAVRSLGKSFWMSRSTCATMWTEKDRDWDPNATYFLYGIPIRYDDRMPYRVITLERRQ